MTIESGALIQVPFEAVPFRGIVEQSLVGMYVVQDERIAYANEKLAQMYGYQMDEFVGIPIADLIAPGSIDEVQRNYHLRMSGEVPTIQYSAQCRHRDGHVMHLQLHASRVECQGRTSLAGVAIDVTERVQQQEELRRSHEQLRELAQRVNSAREAERARMAREVHDVLGGMLTSVKMDLTRIVRRVGEPGQEELLGIASDLVALVQETIDTARAISEQMRPGSLDRWG